MNAESAKDFATRWHGEDLVTAVYLSEIEGYRFGEIIEAKVGLDSRWQLVKNKLFPKIEIIRSRS